MKPDADESRETIVGVHGTTGPRPSRWTTPLAGLFLLAHTVLAWSGRAFGMNTGNDDATYLLLARSLRDFSYRDHHLLGAPVHSQYPPGLPAFLALLSIPFGERFDIYLGAIVLASVAALALLYDVMRRRCGETVALTVLALCAVNPALVDYAGSLASESLYLFFTALAVWAVAREPRDGEPGERAYRWTILVIAAAVGAALTRTIGLTMLCALFISWLVERRYRRALALAAAVALTAGTWLLWTILAPGKIVGRSYIADATFRASAGRDFLNVLVDRVTSNVPTYLSFSVPSVLPQPTVAGTGLDNIIGAVALLGLGALGVKVLWKKAPFVVVYLATYGALLAMWPWKVTRFLVPIVPFLLWILIGGAVRLATRRRWLRAVPFVIAGLIFLTALRRDASSLMVAARCDRSSPTTTGNCFTEPQRAFFAVIAFVKRFTPDTSVFLTVKESTFGYLGARRALAHEALGARDPAEMFRTLRERGVEFIVLTPLREYDVQHVPMLLQACGDLELVKEFSPITFVLRVRGPDSGAPRENACAALERYRREQARWTSQPTR